MKNSIFTISLLLGIGCISADAARQISSFRELSIQSGSSVEINGVQQSQPDIYYNELPDGTWEAVRLTVTPPSGKSDFTVPYLNNCTPTSIRVNWKTGAKAPGSVVRYGLSPDNLDQTAQATARAKNRSYNWNTAELSGLQPGSVYYYKVFSNGNESDTYRFRTMPQTSSKEKIRVLFIGDHQRNEHSDYEWLINAARRTVAEKYGDGPFEDHINFLMNDGDQVDGGDLSLYEKVHLYKSRFISPTLPNMTAVGNHEYKGDANLAFYDMHYHEYGDIAYRGITSGNCGYYAYQAGCALFLVLNSDDTSVAQKMWVRKIIAAASTDETVDFIVSVQHRPLYAEQWTYDVSDWMRNEIMPILSSTPKHVLNCAGHHHLYARGQMTDTPVYHIISGGGVGTTVEGYEQLWGHTPDNRNHEEVQKTIDHWTYQILEFDPATKEMAVETYSIGNSRLALDNEQVDRFTRKVSGTTPPAQPAIIPADGTVTLPHTFCQAGQTARPYAVQYQISADESFNNLLVNKLITSEDFYGADENYMPLDLNKDADLLTYTLDNGTMANGAYYIRVRNRNSNLDWSEYSRPQKFTIEGAADPGAVALNGRFFRSGSQISLSYAGAPIGTDAWVGIYRDGHRPGSENQSVLYSYTSAASGNWEFTAPEPGVYFATLFKDGGYTEISPRISFVCSNNCDDSNPPVIETDKDVYNVGDPIVVTHRHAPAISKDWIGLYSAGVAPANGKSHSYQYVGQEPDGTVTLNISGNINYTSPVEDGIYYVGYFNTDGYHESTDRVYVIIGKPVLIDTDKDEYLPTDNIRAVYDGAPAREDNRIAIYRGTELVAEQTAPATGGHVEFQPLPAGNYEICMLTSGNDEISQRKALTVTESSSLTETESAGFTISAAGNSITVTLADGITNVSISAIDGRLVASHNADGKPTATLDCTPSPGIYIVTVNNLFSEKIIIK